MVKKTSARCRTRIYGGLKITLGLRLIPQCRDQYKDICSTLLCFSPFRQFSLHLMPRPAVSFNILISFLFFYLNRYLSSVYLSRHLYVLKITVQSCLIRDKDHNLFVFFLTIIHQVYVELKINSSFNFVKICQINKFCFFFV